MKSINKMRIIYPAEFNAENEYLRTFFDYIGIIVYDEKIFNSQYSDAWDKHLKMINDIDGVDIVLNYYTDYSVPNPLFNKRIYLYFDLERKICCIRSTPVPNLSYLTNDRSANVSKKDLRSEVLDLLIDKIWHDDIKNKEAIKLIKECYNSKTMDSDLFYILQAAYSCIDVFDSYIIKSHNAQMGETNQKSSIIETKLLLKGYIIKIFEELWRVCCLLINNDSPYVNYVTINNSILLLILFNHLSDSQKRNVSGISYNNIPLQIQTNLDIYKKIYKLVSNYPWFTKGMFAGLSFGVKSDDICNYLLNCISKSHFPIYYAPVFNALGYRYIEEGKKYEDVVTAFKKTLEFSSNNFNANFQVALLESSFGYLENGEYYFKKILNDLGTDCLRNQTTKYRDLFSLSELFKSFQVVIMISKIAISSNREYTARARVNDGLLFAEYYEEIPLIKRIADNDENAYQEFMLYHKYSVPVYALYSYLQPWINSITNDSVSRTILQKRLSKFLNNNGNK